MVFSGGQRVFAAHHPSLSKNGLFMKLTHLVFWLLDKSRKPTKRWVLCNCNIQKAGMCFCLKRPNFDSLPPSPCFGVIIKPIIFLKRYRMRFIAYPIQGE